MQAPDRPRRPIRRMQRTRESCRASSAHHVPGAVGGIVIDKDDFPGHAGERGLQPPEQRGDVVALVEGGHDHRKLRQTRGLRRVFGARSDGFIHAASVYPQPPAMPRRSSTKPVGKTAAEDVNRAKTGPKMPTTTNNRRAYIRRSRAIQWSSQRRSYQASTSPLAAILGMIGDVPQGAVFGRFPNCQAYWGISLTTGPLTAGGAQAGVFGGSIC